MILKELSEAMGVSGDESAVRKIVLNAIDGHAENIHIDSLGSVTAIKPGTGGSSNPRIMLSAHMDEIGFMVRGVDSDGLLRFSNIGGIDPRILPGLRVKVGEKSAARGYHLDAHSSESRPEHREIEQSAH